MPCQSYFEALQRRMQSGEFFGKEKLSRRDAMVATAAGLLPWLLSSSSLAQVSFGRKESHSLVVLFLRGGADGLNMLVPYEEDEYYRQRPSIAIAKPNDRTHSESERSVKLTDQFALHPALAKLKPWYEKEALTLAHAVGSQDGTRSHFEAMSAMERGAATGHSGEPSGWLARYLRLTAGEKESPLRTIAWADTVPDSLRGAPAPLVVQSISEFQLKTDQEFRNELEKMYGSGKNSVAQSGRETLDALRRIEQLSPGSYRPDDGATYPATPLGTGFKEVASLLKADVGLEIASLEDTGWDNHVAQGGALGFQANGLKNVAECLDAFMTDLGTELRKRTTVIVMTEFGRRVGENQGLGTDHGRASVMMALGAYPGGRIIGQWPGLGKNQVDSVGDLKPVNDYRTMLNEFLGAPMPEIRNVWS